MRQSDIRERVVVPLTSGMNLMDMEINTDDNGEVREVVLKYVPAYEGPERMPAGIHKSRRLCGPGQAAQERSGL